MKEWIVGIPAPSYSKNPVYLRGSYIGFVTRDRINPKRFVACYYTGEIMQDMFESFKAAERGLRQLHKERNHVKTTAPNNAR